MKLKNSMKILFALTASVLAIGAQAHTDLRGSQPAADSVVSEAPTQLRLDYGGKVNLIKLTLTDSEGQPVTIPFKPSSKANNSFSLPLPELQSGRYTVRWSALGADGHVMKGEFAFTADLNQP